MYNNITKSSTIVKKLFSNVLYFCADVSETKQLNEKEGLKSNSGAKTDEINGDTLNVNDGNGQESKSSRYLNYKLYLFFCDVIESSTQYKLISLYIT